MQVRYQAAPRPDVFSFHALLRVVPTAANRLKTEPRLHNHT
jgi:hypothetical protein